MLSGNDVKGTILQTVENDMGLALSQAAMAYGMYTAYACTLPEGNPIRDGLATMQPANALDAFDWTDESNAGFKAYLQSDVAKADLQGYLSAMNMVNDSTGDPDAVSGVLVNGFADANLVTLLQGATGKN